MFVTIHGIYYHRATLLFLLGIISIISTACEDATPVEEFEDTSNDIVQMEEDIGILGNDMLLPNGPTSDFSMVDSSDMITQDSDLSTEADLNLLDAMNPVEPPPIPIYAEVKLASVETAAGIENRISCLAYDNTGTIIEDLAYVGTAQFDVRPLDGWINNSEEPQLFKGIMAGDYQVRCQLPQWGLRSDQKPWSVIPSMPHRSVVQLSTQDIRAGESVDLSCVVVDEWDNLITTQEYSESLNQMNPEDIGIPTVDWSIMPALADLVVEAGTWSFTQAGEFDFQCSVAGVSESYSNSLLVRPGLPALLIAELDQGKTQYFFNEVVTVNYVINDAYDNEVTGVAVSVDSTPEMESFGDRRFLAQTPGTYEIIVDVTGDTDQDVELRESLTINVDDGAPQIQCTTPSIGEMRSEVPFFLNGTVNDISALAEVTVDGEIVLVDAQGTFSKQVAPTWGLNIHELAARDEFGQINTALCIFFASDHYLNNSSNAYINDVASLHISQAAIDDGAPRVPRESFGDLLDAIINSSALLETIDQALDAQNPIVNTSYEIACVPFLGCATASARANYESLSINGSRTVSLQLINGGMNIQANFNNLRLGLSTRLSATGITITPSGFVTVDSLGININLNIGLNGQTPVVTIRGTPTISVGNIDLSLNISNSFFSAIINPFTNLVFSLFEDLVRNTLVTQMRTYLSTEFDSLLSNLLSSLDLSNLSLDLTLPHPLGGQAIDLDVLFALNRIEANTSRLKIGLKSRVTSSSRHNRATPGIPTPEPVNSIELNPGVGRDAAGSSDIALINSVLYRLWKAGLFDITDISSLLGNQEGIDISFQTLTPPAINLQSPGVKARLHFGPALAQVSYPGLFDDPISLYLAAYATAQISINDQNELSFGSLIIEDLKLSAVDLALSPESRFALQQTFTEILQSMFDTTLNQALPNLPIPDFALPNSFSQYGIPNNTRLGVRNMRLYRVNQTLQVKGNFGL